MAVVEKNHIRGVQKHQERPPETTIRDTRPLRYKVAETLRARDFSAMILGLLGVVAIIIPMMTEIALIIGVLYFLWLGSVKVRLPFKMPTSFAGMDWGNIKPNGKPADRGEGIAYIGRDRMSGEELWLTNSDMRTHMLVLGTTGAGKPQPKSSRVAVPVCNRWPDGWARIGDLVVGDTVVLPGGGTAPITGTWEQGPLQTWRVVTAGDRTARSSGDHLWKVRLQHASGVTKDVVLSLFEVMEVIQNEMADRVLVPVAEPGSTRVTWTPILDIEPTGVEECCCISVASDEQLYITDNGVVTHNTEALLSFVCNALTWSSGFLYTDGKGDTSLYSKVYSMARRFGRDDDVLVLNFMKGNTDKAGESNTMNPFAMGSAAVLTEMIVSLMGDSGGGDDMWKGRAVSLMTALMMTFTRLRDEGYLTLNVDVIRKLLGLPQIVSLYYGREIHVGEAGTAGEVHLTNYQLSKKARNAINSYLDALPGFSWQKAQEGKDQAQTTMDQHGYLFMQFTRPLGELADTYDFIFATQFAEIDLEDVVLNRRILVVLLPALEKSEDNISMLGKIIVASLKSMMGKTLGAKLEGYTADIIDTKPTNSSSPYMTVLDEVGYYTVPGMAVMPAQARSLGFSMIFAGQDVSAMKKRGGSVEKEVDAIIANCNFKAFGKLEDPGPTYELFEKSVGKAVVSEVSGYSITTGSATLTYRDMGNASIKDRSRGDYLDLKDQTEGQFHMMFASTLVRAAAFYAAPKVVKYLKINRKVQVPDPTASMISHDGVVKQVSRILMLLALPNAVVKPSPLDEASGAIDLQIVNGIMNGYPKAKPPQRAAIAIAAVREYFSGNKPDSLVITPKSAAASSGGDTPAVDGKTAMDEDLLDGAVADTRQINRQNATAMALLNQQLGMPEKEYVPAGGGRPDLESMLDLKHADVDDGLGGLMGHDMERGHKVGTEDFDDLDDDDALLDGVDGGNGFKAISSVDDDEFDRYHEDDEDIDASKGHRLRDQVATALGGRPFDNLDEFEDEDEDGEDGAGSQEGAVWKDDDEYAAARSQFTRINKALLGDSEAAAMARAADTMATVEKASKHTPGKPQPHGGPEQKNNIIAALAILHESISAGSMAGRDTPSDTGQEKAASVADEMSVLVEEPSPVEERKSSPPVRHDTSAMDMLDKDLFLVGSDDEDE